MNVWINGPRQTCVCGGGWARHCKHKACRWLRCTTCSAIYDVTGQRLWFLLRDVA